jgi:hypothetical protein
MATENKSRFMTISPKHCRHCQRYMPEIYGDESCGRLFKFASIARDHGAALLLAAFVLSAAAYLE